MDKNYDDDTVKGFGQEWTAFNQSSLQKEELHDIFTAYFKIFPLHKLDSNSVGFDLGCGSGRWASLIAPKVGKLFCIDASKEAVNIAKKNLSHFSNVEFIQASVEAMPLPDNSMDFGYSLGVLHHIPDTEAGIKACVKKLKLGAPLLLYIYYAFDNKPAWFRYLWKISDSLRKIISHLPFFFKYIFSQCMALFIYYPLARLSRTLEKLGFAINNIPLSAYRNRSFYVMQTDALDRFGTRLEQRFTQEKITAMMKKAGLENISFSSHTPYWCAIGYKKI